MAQNTAEELLRIEWKQMSEQERQVFFSKLIHAVNHHDFALFYADCIVKGAEKEGVFDNVKFGEAVYEN